MTELYTYQMVLLARMESFPTSGEDITLHKDFHIHYNGYENTTNLVLKFLTLGQHSYLQY